MTFEEQVINETVTKLIAGEDYRMEVINHINAVFMDYMNGFLKDVIIAKSQGGEHWYRDFFMNEQRFDSTEIAIHSGLNRKTITNVYGTARKDVMIEAATENLDYLKHTITTVYNEIDDFDFNMILTDDEGTSYTLNLIESYLVINTLTTKKAAIRGGAWSSIGKKVEKPLLNRLCELVGVPRENVDDSIFRRDENLDFDREVDFKLIDSDGNIYRTEVKLMGRGNPESADASIARDSQIFVADTLSAQNKAQLESRGVKWLELKDNNNTLDDFRTILTDLNIPFTN